MKKNAIKFISLFLSVVMLTTIMPIGVYAQDEEDFSMETSTENVEIECEIESKRTENSKTYLTEDGGYYQISATVPIHEKIEGEWEDIVEINDNIDTIADVETAISNVTSLVSSDSNDQNGFYQDEALTLYTNGSTDEIKIAGALKTNSSIKSCVYVKPNIISDKSVFISNATLTVTTGAVSTEDNSNVIKVFRLKNELSQPENAPLDVYDNVTIDKQLATSNNNYCKLDVTSYAHYSSLGIYENSGLALEPAYKNTSIEIQSVVFGIYYREIGDVDKNIESETLNLGRAGTLYINDYTCSPLIVRNDLSIYDELAQVNIQTIINPAALDENISDGANTRTNYYSVLQYASGEYYWKNCEGDYIYFVRNTDTKYVGIDSSGNNYVLTCTNVKNDYSNITIESSKDKTTYSFKTISDKGYLKNIKYILTDENDKEYINDINIFYDDINISYITDGSGRKYKYNYTDGMLSSISVYYYADGVENPVKINDEEVTILYSYDEYKRLEKVIYPDGYYVIYTYDDNKLIDIESFETTNSSVTSLKKLTLSYLDNTYDSKIVSRYTLKDKGETVKIIDVSTPIGSVYNRIFKNITDGTEKIMQYNSNSNLIHYKDYNGQEYYLNYSNKKLEKLIYAETSTSNIIQNGDFNSNSNWTMDDKASIKNGVDDNVPVKDDSDTSNKALLIEKDNFSDSGVTQTVKVTPGKSYILSCAAYCSQAIPFNSDRYYSVTVTGSASGTLVGETNFDYNIVGNWQTSRCIINIPSTITSVKITINSLEMPGDCYFDDISMYLANDENTTDISSESDISNYKTIRNDYGQITDVVKNVVENSTIRKHYEYDESHYKSLVDDEGVITYYNYDCGSGLLMSKGKNNDSTKNTQYIYSGIGALTAVQQAISTASNDSLNQSVEYTYDDDKISSIYHNGCLYEYTYNKNGLVENISVKDSQQENAKTDFSISYNYDNENVGQVVFGNGSSITYTYDGNNITQTIYNNGKEGEENKTYVYSYEYSANGKVTKMTDNVSNTVTTYSDSGSTITKNGTTIYSNNGKKMNLFGNSFSYSSSETTKNNKTTITESTSASAIGPNVDTEVVLDGFDRTITSQITNKASTDLNTHYRLTEETEYLATSNNRQVSLVEHYTSTVAKRKNRLSETYNNNRMTREWFYEYDDVGRLIKAFKKSSSNVTYNSENNSSYGSDKGNIINYYEYDEAGEITFEFNADTKKAIVYTYDAGGNIKSKKVYDNTDSTMFSYSYDYNNGIFKFTPITSGQVINYTYKQNGMTDYLTSFNGYTIEYDTSGNPITYSGKGVNDAKVRGTMEWNGNLLTTFISNSGGRYEYTYDGDGHRTSKTFYADKEDTIPKSIIEYVWEGDTLIGYRTRYYGYDFSSDAEQTPENYVLNWDKTIKLIYSDEKLVGASVVAGKNETTSNELSEYFDWEQSGNYTFIHDGQGNITDVYDSSEKVVVSISYDAYGNMTQNYSGSYIEEIMTSGDSGDSLLGQLLLAIVQSALISVYLNGMFLSVEQGFNGYIFDSETGLYYGQERYYSPSWGRFLNASDPMTLTEDTSSIYTANLFNYCGNDPINNISKTGFNAPCKVISNSIIPQITNTSSNLFNENRSTAKSVGEISTAFDTLGLSLSTTNDIEAKNYWDEALNKDKDVVDNSYGLNYIQSAISKNTSSITKYSVDEMNTPYKISKSIQ